MDRLSVWDHKLAAEEIIAPILVVKGKGNRRGKTREKRKKGTKRQHKTENINLSLS